MMSEFPPTTDDFAATAAALACWTVHDCESIIPGGFADLTPANQSPTSASSAALRGVIVIVSSATSAAAVPEGLNTKVAKAGV